MTRIAISLKRLHHPSPIRNRTILAHLPLPLQPRNHNLHTNNPLKLAPNKIRWRIIHAPLPRKSRLVMFRQLPDITFQIHSILKRPKPPPGMNHNKVISRNHPSSLIFRLVPGRTYIGRRPLEDRQSFRFHKRFPPLRIRPRNMSPQHPERSRRRIENHRNVVRHQPVRSQSHYGRQGVLPDERMKDLSPILPEMLRNIHWSKISTDRPTRRKTEAGSDTQPIGRRPGSHISLPTRSSGATPIRALCARGVGSPGVVHTSNKLF